MSRTSQSPAERIQELETVNEQLCEIIRAKDETIVSLSKIVEQLTAAQTALCTEAQRLLIAKDKLMRELETQNAQAQELHNKYKLLARQVMEM